MSKNTFSKALEEFGKAAELISSAVEKLLLVTIDLKNREYHEKQSEKPHAGSPQAKKE